MSNITFKPVEEAHLSEILEIYTYYILNTTVTFHIDPISIEQMKEIVNLNNSFYKTFVIFMEETLCGYVLFTQHKKREAYNTTAEVTIYLKPEFSGKGIGKAALSFIENEAKNAGIHALVATITNENIASVKLFEKNGYFKCAGYKEVGKKFGRYLDLIAYEKILE
jgi:L-amino acid N-acyltransferase YncA